MMAAGLIKMSNRLMSSVSSFLDRYRPNNIENETLEEEWDNEDNTENHPLYSISDGGVVTQIDARSSGFTGFREAPGIYYQGVHPSVMASGVVTTDSSNVVWFDEATNIRQTQHPDYTFQLNNGQEITVRIIENQEALEVEFDGEIMATQIEDGKITLRRAYDEENNASQNNRTHEQPAEDSAHCGENLLQQGETVVNTYF